MPGVPHWTVQIAEPIFFVNGNGFLQFGKGFEIDLPVAVSDGKIEAFVHELPAQPFASCGDVQVHLYELAGVCGQSGGGVDTAAAGDPSVEEAHEVAAAGRTEIFKHIIERAVIIGGSGPIDPVFPEGGANDRSDLFIVRLLYRPDVDGIHGAKVGKAVYSGPDVGQTEVGPDENKKLAEEGYQAV